MSIIGKAGTKLVFTENSFIIDFEPENADESFEISEVNLEMAFTKRKRNSENSETANKEPGTLPGKIDFYDNITDFQRKYHSLTIKSQNTTPSIMKDYLVPFFVIKGNSKVELRDCLIAIHTKPSITKKKSISKSTDLKKKTDHSYKEEFKRISTSNSPELIQIAFLLEKKRKKFPKLALYSCNVSGFAQVCECENNSSLLLERSRFLDIKFHAMNLSNPFQLFVNGCNFNKIGLSCLNIRLSRTVEEIRKIVIEDNDFYENDYAISFYSETKDFLTYITEFIENRCSYSTKDAFRVKNLNSIGLEIVHNEIKNSKRNGIFLQGVYNQESDIPVMLKLNRVTHCESLGFHIQDSMVTVEENAILVNVQGGILIEGISGMPKSRAILANLNVNQNQGFGVMVKGLFNSSLRISNSIFMENKNGILFETIGKLSQHFISNNKIVNNLEAGVKLLHLNGKIYFVDNYFEGNVVCEIYSQLTSHSFVDLKNQKVKKLVSSEGKKKLCSIF